MAITTSGTVSTTVFETRRLIDRAFGRCKLAPQQITAEYIQIAKDWLYLFLSTLSNKGVPTWCIEKLILPLYQAQQSVPCPQSTVDVLNANLRFISQIQLSPGPIYSASGGIAANAFDDDLSTACIQTDPAGWIQVQYQSASNPVVFGIMPNATGTWDIELQTSNNGINWTTIWAEAEFAAVQSQWFWVDIEGIPENGISYVRLQANGTTILNVTEIVTGAAPNEIPLAKINRDDYSNLPNKFFLGQPVQFWYDKQFDQPILTLWPAPQLRFTFMQLVLYVTQYVQDVGTMTESIAVPQRWYRAIVEQLALELAGEIPEVDWSDPRIQILPASAEKILSEAWASESDGSPIRVIPQIGCYTR